MNQHFHVERVCAVRAHSASMSVSSVSGVCRTEARDHGSMSPPAVYEGDILLQATIKLVTVISELVGPSCTIVDGGAFLP